MKIFLSQPMAGRTEAEILGERRYVTKKLKNCYGEDIEILHSYSDGPEPVLYKLGTAIQVMAYADAVYFLPGWEDSRGCRIEYECAQAYDLDCYEIFYREDEYED